MAGREAQARWQAAALERQLLSAEAKSLETEASLTAATMQAAGKLSSLFRSRLFDQWKHRTSGEHIRFAFNFCLAAAVCFWTVDLTATANLNRYVITRRGRLQLASI